MTPDRFDTLSEIPVSLTLKLNREIGWHIVRMGMASGLKDVLN